MGPLLERLRRRGRTRDDIHDRTGSDRRGRRLVVGDIHGCARTARALLSTNLAVTPVDHVYLLGDLVSKGPDSLGVLTYVAELQDAEVPITFIRGNHEEAILKAAAAKKSKLKSLLDRTQNGALLDPSDDRRLDPRWQVMFESSIYHVELADAILVHGGIDFSRGDPYADTAVLVNARETAYRSDRAGGRVVVHGHTRTPLSTIIERLVEHGPVVPLDNGAVGAGARKPYKISEYGNLCCLDLDAWELHVQPNLDIDPVEGEPAYRVRVRPLVEQREDHA